MTAQTFQATFKAKVVSAVPASRPAELDLFNQDGIDLIYNNIILMLLS